MESSNTVATPGQPRRKGLAIALWSTQGILAVLFIYAGVMKFVMPIEVMTKGSPFPGAFFHFIGAMEVLGGIGLVLPAMLRIAPMLTPLAACGLTIIMIGGTVVSAPMGLAVALFPFCVGLLTVFAAYGRLKLLPVAPRG